MAYINVNPNKEMCIRANGKVYVRNAIKTHFVKPKESYLDLVEKYVVPVWEDDAILFISEKIIALCQNRVVYKKNIKLGFWAKTLSKFVMKTKAGFSVGNPYKMQVAIQNAGLPRILFAAFCSAVTKPFGIKGVFYIVAGNEINGIDGFYGDAFPEYEEIGILNPENPDLSCKEIEETFGFKTVIVDANDIGINVLGKSPSVTLKDDELIAIIKDNPAGQSNNQTPFIVAFENKEKKEEDNNECKIQGYVSKKPSLKDDLLAYVYIKSDNEYFPEMKIPINKKHYNKIKLGESIKIKIS